MEYYQLDDIEKITQETQNFVRKIRYNEYVTPAQVQYNCCTTRSSHCPL